MLGADVVRTAEAAGHEVLGLGRDELDVLDEAAVTRRMEAERPTAVVHCAAYTDVDGAEGDVRAAMDGNAEATALVAAAAARVEATTVYPSSDYVFDGLKGEPYVESDPPRPLSVYGRSKLAGETAVAAAGPRHVIARSSWLFGRDGRNFVETMLRLGAEHGEVRVVSDQVGCPTYTPHLADALVRVLELGGLGVHHLAATGECSWFEFAREIFSRSPLEPRLTPCTTEELGRPAPRPPYSALLSERSDAVSLPGWESGLGAYLAERAPVAT